MLEVHSTKSFIHLPTAHCQYFDLEPDGSPGDCASVHGYDRTVKFTFSGTVDEHGWLVPFGELGKVKQFLEYYFDHVTVLPADDPRLDSLLKLKDLLIPGGILGTLRVLPYGVSMEMSSVFIWEQVNPYIMDITSGRAYISRVECIEHERNSAFITVDRDTAEHNWNSTAHLTPMFKKPRWDFVAPLDRIDQINSY